MSVHERVGLSWRNVSLIKHYYTAQIREGSEEDILPAQLGVEVCVNWDYMPINEAVFFFFFLGLDMIH